MSGAVGKRVRLRGTHPHRREYGVVVGTKMLDGAVALEIELECCPHGLERCFAFLGDWRLA